MSCLSPLLCSIRRQLCIQEWVPLTCICLFVCLFVCLFDVLFVVLLWEVFLCHRGCVTGKYFFDLCCVLLWEGLLIYLVLSVFFLAGSAAHL